MTILAAAFASALDPDRAAVQVVDRIEGALGAGRPVAGAFVFASAASGDGGQRVGRLLAERWPAAELLGTGFEGLIGEGRVWLGEPAVAVLAWTEGGASPLPIVVSTAGRDPGLVAQEIRELVDSSSTGPEDVCLLFPDAIGAAFLVPLLERFGPSSGGPRLAGAASSGAESGASLAWSSPDVADPGGGLLVGLLIPGRLPGGPTGGQSDGRRVDPVCERVRCAGASRRASPWLEVSACRPHWVDGLEGEPPVVWIRRQLGLGAEDEVEPTLERLLVRLARGEAGWDGEGEPASYEERFVTGVDRRRGAIGVMGRFARFDRLAFALPDPGLARESLRAAVDALPRTPLLVQLGCASLGAALHGDRDLESAVVASQVFGGVTIGVIAPFQLAADPGAGAGLRVHTTVLAAAGPVREA